jgi:hypothetical protein
MDAIPGFQNLCSFVNCIKFYCIIFSVENYVSEWKCGGVPVVFGPQNSTRMAYRYMIMKSAFIPKYVCRAVGHSSFSGVLSPATTIQSTINIGTFFGMATFPFNLTNNSRFFHYFSEIVLTNDQTIPNCEFNLKGVGIFIFLVALKWTSNFHFLPALSEAESFFNIFSKIVFQSVGIGRRRTGCIFGKVVLLAKSKAGGSEAAFVFNIVKFVASTQCNETCT